VDPTIDIKPIDPEWLKADLQKALEYYDTGRFDLAAESIEASVAKL
jgi:hypothetical protein